MANRVLITGANGFIGSHLAGEMIATDIPITAIVRPSSNVDNLKALKCFNIVSASSYTDPSLVRQLSVSKPEYLIHCAWEDKNSFMATSKKLSDLFKDNFKKYGNKIEHLVVGGPI